MVLKGVRGFRDDYIEHIEHGRCGGVQNQPVPVKIIGIPDRFGESGDPELLYRDCHMDTASIVEEAMKLAESK